MPPRPFMQSAAARARSSPFESATTTTCSTCDPSETYNTNTCVNVIPEGWSYQTNCVPVYSNLFWGLAVGLPLSLLAACTVCYIFSCRCRACNGDGNSGQVEEHEVELGASNPIVYIVHTQGLPTEWERPRTPGRGGSKKSARV